MMKMKENYCGDDDDVNGCVTSSPSTVGTSTSTNASSDGRNYSTSVYNSNQSPFTETGDIEDAPPREHNLHKNEKFGNYHQNGKQIKNAQQEEDQAKDEECPDVQPSSSSSSSYTSTFSFDNISKFPQELVEKVDWITQCHNPIEYLQTIGFVKPSSLSTKKELDELQQRRDENNTIYDVDPIIADDGNERTSTTTPFVAFQVPVHCEYCGSPSAKDCYRSCCHRPKTYFPRKRPPFYDALKWKEEQQSKNYSHSINDAVDNINEQRRRTINLQPFRPSYYVTENGKSETIALSLRRRDVVNTISSRYKQHGGEIPLLQQPATPSLYPSSHSSSSSMGIRRWLARTNNRNMTWSTSTTDQRISHLQSSPIIFSSIPEEQQSTISSSSTLSIQ
jgi:hypothetical protein